MVGTQHPLGVGQGGLEQRHRPPQITRVPVSGRLRQRLSSHTIMLLELWAWAWPGPNVYVLAASMLPVALVIPLTNSLVMPYRLAVTPDRLIGRVDSVRGTDSLALAPLGSLVAGALLTACRCDGRSWCSRVRRCHWRSGARSAGRCDQE